MSKRSPFPIPFGWFQVAWSEEVATAQVLPVEYFGKRLALWRDESGAPHLNDAFCPHLGAHFGHGGSVIGEELVCPFHGWRFDAEGQNTLIPYADRTNKKACVTAYPTIERNGLVMAWYHPESVAPMWEIPEIPEFNDPSGFTQMVTREYTVHAPWQELAENGVDAAHFRYVHHTEEVPELQSYEIDGPFTKMRSSQKFPTPRGVVDGRIDADSFGPGLSSVHFSGIIDTILMGCNTPIDEDTCHMRFSFTVRKLGTDEALNSSVGAAFVDEVHRQVLEDKPIWENKAHLVRPALAATDGPFMKFRKWAGQFYAETVDDSALVYEPQADYPAVLGETASRKYGSDPFANA
ncbi:Rieske (2Fe-2S) domain-containing protein [Actinobacteria bacterium IMCC26207]|nr:Rieske (2Fe-2S) domain-containing protein [Actinobacteria bacterium IMCC26207]